ncbi:hypothetical protein [Methylovirgula sp. HY1]|uniref:hypothetical protein n=1 Tax=Methylovirgula sp. HY1 TaxID=2822761 RepID=UPI001C5B79DC|nr:hypothetical protein [Methylovirgula sp. HY1]
MTSRIDFSCFVLPHLYLYAQAVDAADLDINQVAEDVAYPALSKPDRGSARPYRGSL